MIVIGGGAAGLLAAARAAERGCRVLTLEKNRRPGVKILMSGGTRCNVTHDTDARGIIEAYGAKGQGRFLHSALAALGPRELVALIEAEGVPLKVEPGGKIFPVSNKATDVLDALLRLHERSGAQLATEQAVRGIERTAAGFRIVTDREEFSTRQVIVASGGKSYPGCGASGDGYGWLHELGHEITPLRPALTPLRSTEPWIKRLSGVTLADVEVRVVEPPDRELARRRAGFLFAHFGLSGPAALDVSRAVTCHAHPGKLLLVCDFLPGTTADQLEASLGPAGGGAKAVATGLAMHLPRRLVDELLIIASAPPEKRLAELSRHDRRAIVEAVKRLRIPLAGALGFEKAEVTTGGVKLDEVDSRTMQSKLVPGLYIIGEVLDLDGPIGGYNFQSAFSTGYLAGNSVLTAE